MECQKIINLLEKTPKPLSKFRTKNWVKVNDESRRTYDFNKEIKFKASMLKLNLCDHSDAHILVNATVSNTVAAGVAANNRKDIIIKNCALFTYSISEINST